jgi:hypothetical protein
LCGHVLSCDTARRYKKHDVLKQLVIRKCIPTAYVYSCVVNYRGAGKHTVCIACVNWTRRLSIRKGKDLVFIPIDNVILFVMQPGEYLEPDKRTLVRLLHSLCVPVVVEEEPRNSVLNQYSSFESGCMRSVKKVLLEKYFVAGQEVDISDYHKEPVIDTIIREWWIFNGMPCFLDNKRIGRYVRKMLRTHKLNITFSTTFK